MSVANSIQKGDFKLNVISLRKPLEFADGTIQDTAYTGGGGIPNLEEVLTAGNNAQGLDITGVNVLTMVSSGGASAQIIQNNLIASQFNVLNTSAIVDDNSAGQVYTLSVRDTLTGQEIQFNPATNNNYQNPITEANDATIIGSVADTGRNLTITNNSATTNGIRIADTSVLIGAGGNADIPTVNTVYNNPAGTATTTTTAGVVFQASTIEPTPTIQVKDVPTGQSLYFIPKANAGNYNPITQNNNQQIIAWGSAGNNTQTLELIPHSSTACGIRMSGAGIPYAEIGCGGGGTDPSSRINFTTNATTEFGVSHQFVNCVAQYDPVGQAERLIPSIPSLSASIAPCFEVLTAHITGGGSSDNPTFVLQHNIHGTTNYAVFPTVYYGYSGSSGTYDLSGTSGTIQQMVVNSITATQFNVFFNRGSGDNLNVYVSCLVVYDAPNTDYPKAY
jgi:hypothetical protein